MKKCKMIVGWYLQTLYLYDIMNIYTEWGMGMETRKKRIGDRKDGYRVRTLPPLNNVSPYIMKTRVGSSNYVRDTIDTDRAEQYIRKKRSEGLKGFGMMHVIIASYIRVVSQRPAINRFIGGQKIFSRKNIVIVLAVKLEMTLDSPETIIKAEFRPDATADDVYNELTRIIDEYRSSPGGSFDKTANILHFIPGLFLKFAIWFLNLLDYFGHLPKKLLKLSPFHGSFFITSMGSLGIPPIYHHLYNFGNVPVFLSFGATERRNEIAADGKVVSKKYVDYTVVTDERICDGFYYASALKLLKRIMKNPFCLDERPKEEEVIHDID